MSLCSGNHCSGVTYLSLLTLGPGIPLRSNNSTSPHHCPDLLSECHCRCAAAVHDLLPSEYHHLESVDESGTQVWSVPSLADEYVLNNVTAVVAPPESEDP